MAAENVSTSAHTTNVRFIGGGDVAGIEIKHFADESGFVEKIVYRGFVRELLAANLIHDEMLPVGRERVKSCRYPSIPTNWHWSVKKLKVDRIELTRWTDNPARVRKLSSKTERRMNDIAIDCAKEFSAVLLDYSLRTGNGIDNDYIARNSIALAKSMLAGFIDERLI